MSAIARIPIDLCDTRVPLPEALKVFEEFTAEAGQKHFQDDKRRTIYVSNSSTSESYVWPSLHTNNMKQRLIV